MRKEIRKEEGITLVSLVVTIIILIILAGVSINAVIGENGIITIAKRAKENVELAQIEEQTKLNELYMQIEREEGEIGRLPYDAIGNLAEFKRKIADYIEDAANGSVDTTNEFVKPDYKTASTETFGKAIKQIVKEVTKDATAASGNILKGKTAWVNGKKVTGTMNNYSGNVLNATVTTDDQYAYLTIPSNGYYSTTSKLKTDLSNIIGNNEKVVFGTLSTTKGVNNIDIGFQPDVIFVRKNNGTNINALGILYMSNISTTQFLYYNQATQNNAFNIGNINYNFVFYSINTTGFSINDKDGNSEIIYFAAKY